MVFKFSGFISEEGSFDTSRQPEDHLAIVTYWKSFEQHERSHADDVFKKKFAQLAEYCTGTYEIGYELLWQGQPE